MLQKHCNFAMKLKQTNVELSCQVSVPKVGRKRDVRFDSATKTAFV
jgi:hypothetical protein